MSALAATLNPLRILLPCALAGFALLLLLQRNLMLGLGALVVLGCLAVAFRWPEIGTLVFLFALYSNVAVLAMRSQQDVQLSAGTVDQNPRIAMVLAALFVLLCVSLLHQVFIRKKRLVFDRGLFLMLMFLLALLVSTIFARDKDLAESQIVDYLLEGLGLYFLVVNVIRDFATLRRAIWALLLAGGLMGGITVFQKVSHTQQRMYGGFAQVESEFNSGPGGESLEDTLRGRGVSRDKEHEGGESLGEIRAAGPIGETNRYGQMLLVLLPFAALMWSIEPSRRLRRVAVAAGALILGALMLTMSRGSMLAAIIVFAPMAYLRLLRPRQVLMSLLAAGLLIGTVGRDAVARVASLDRLKALFSPSYSSYNAPDSSARLRYVEGVACWHVFLDHPILGVGPGHFAPYYSVSYGSQVGMHSMSSQGYRGHDMYLETLAELGVIGFVCLLAILLMSMQGLWQAYRRTLQSRPQLAYTAAALFLSLMAYAISAIFAHLSYQRYFWLLIALCSAAVHISKQEGADTTIRVRH
jgi:putative inorganic carbon (hco3(-)) transporter